MSYFRSTVLAETRAIEHSLQWTQRTGFSRGGIAGSCRPIDYLDILRFLSRARWKVQAFLGPLPRVCLLFVNSRLYCSEGGPYAHYCRVLTSSISFEEWIWMCAAPPLSTEPT